MGVVKVGIEIGLFVMFMLWGAGCCAAGVSGLGSKFIFNTRTKCVDLSLQIEHLLLKGGVGFFQYLAKNDRYGKYPDRFQYEEAYIQCLFLISIGCFV